MSLVLLRTPKEGVVEFSKDQKVTFSFSTIASVVASLAAVWVFASPIISTALADKIDDKLEPLTVAFEITMTSTIHNLRNAITALEFKRDMCAGEANCWTIRDAQDLTSTRADLTAAESALKRLKRP
jgi:hypothetical protein